MICEECGSDNGHYVTCPNHPNALKPVMGWAKLDEEQYISYRQIIERLMRRLKVSTFTNLETAVDKMIQELQDLKDEVRKREIAGMGGGDRG